MSADAVGGEVEETTAVLVLASAASLCTRVLEPVALRAASAADGVALLAAEVALDALAVAEAPVAFPAAPADVAAEPAVVEPLLAVAEFSAAPAADAAPAAALPSAVDLPLPAVVSFGHSAPAVLAAAVALGVFALAATAAAL